MVKIYRFAVVLFMLGFASNAFALFGTGTYVPYAFKAQNSKDGGRKVFRINPYISVHHSLPIWFGISFVPELGYVMHTGEEDETSKKTIFLRYNFSSSILPMIKLRYGLSTFMTKIGGDGGTVQLNNGAGTSTFYVPSETKTTYMTTLDLGGEFALPLVALRLDLQMMGFASSDKRNLSYMLSVNF